MAMLMTTRWIGRRRSVARRHYVSAVGNDRHRERRHLLRTEIRRHRKLLKEQADQRKKCDPAAMAMAAEHHGENEDL